MDILGNIMWENWRFATGYEDVFNLDDENDADDFANLYGFKKTMECYKQGNFWIGGMNIKNPIELSYAKMINIIADVYNEKLELERINGNSTIITKTFTNDLKSAIHRKSTKPR